MWLPEKFPEISVKVSHFLPNTLHFTSLLTRMSVRKDIDLSAHLRGFTKIVTFALVTASCRYHIK